MGDGQKQFAVAVLIRKRSQWTEALRTAKALRQSGATVSLFCLGYAPMSLDDAMPDDPGFKCYADTRQEAMDCLSLGEIAEQLKRCNLVIAI